MNGKISPRFWHIVTDFLGDPNKDDVFFDRVSSATRLKNPTFTSLGQLQRSEVGLGMGCFGNTTSIPPPK